MALKIPKRTVPTLGMGLHQMIADHQRHVNALPTYDQVPEDVRQHYRDNVADGTVLVIFAPQCTDMGHSDNCDEWGFVTHKILVATRRYKKYAEEGDRFTTPWYADGDNTNKSPSNIQAGTTFALKDGELDYLGDMSMIEKALAANEGDDFRGWKNTQQYRLTSQEISDQLKGQIFNGWRGLGLPRGI